VGARGRELARDVDGRLRALSTLAWEPEGVPWVPELGALALRFPLFESPRL
jgi:hypothetical protein